MEAQVESVMSSIMANPDVVGVLCTDGNGLCLGAQGRASRSSSGFIQALAANARKLSDDESPVVTVETQTMRIMISEASDLTVAVYKLLS